MSDDEAPSGSESRMTMIEHLTELRRRLIIAFASVGLHSTKMLGLSPDKVNVNGGAIAVGHPLAASGARITMQVAYELKRRGAQLGMGSACIGGGQGIALLLEKKYANSLSLVLRRIVLLMQRRLWMKQGSAGGVIKQ